ncbi:sigma-54 dependent transcriptional regulator, putative [Melioribacter roseus P3M-2]|uniref:Sigma-54 dependent transcriptional regulator, putative n=1 Tax=Melioribacter roseus (strain DSM 23840 / JCM 17771 / VKM B-2668 / P3M-2) TaxID=1191523 RepID=I6ZXC3_MELRP|nr:sigma 54-interacting transcriptional regulator [Melioribacter roseus]AFN73708.1 sigma-54 dependent transcriptional regulator, putative [Melioribacter roseus P3M-2]
MNELKLNTISYLTPAVTMDILLEAIQEIVPYELAVISSREGDDKLKVRYAKGPLITDEIYNFEIDLKKRTDIRDVLISGNVKLVEESKDPHHDDTYKGVIDLPLGHSCMLAPLKINGEILGLMTLDHRQCDMFTPMRVNLTNTLSKLISLALAQSIMNDSLLNEKQTLIYERNSLLGDVSSVLEGLVGKSQKWIQIIEKIKLVAPTESHVMILGETGTGKEQVAKSIHALSNRSDKPFITLNCSALNYNLAESELFGHEKGAFTGAVSQRRGRFELADGGTLFLDEIADLPFEIQPKLLRAIQEGTFERLGGEKTIKSDVRIICATNADLLEKVKEGKFREDLYYRLNVFPIKLPPLRERKEDIFLLSNHFIEKLGKKLNKPNITLSEEALSKLKNYSWHGNVRELQNTLERAIILCNYGVIKPEHIIFEYEEINHDTAESDDTIAAFDEEVKKIILRALRKSKGKIYGADGAAALLKLKPTTLQSKMKKLGIA